jgi:hypothetical protein
MVPEAVCRSVVREPLHFIVMSIMGITMPIPVRFSQDDHRQYVPATVMVIAIEKMV